MCIYVYECMYIYIYMNTHIALAPLDHLVRELARARNEVLYLQKETLLF